MLSKKARGHVSAGIGKLATLTVAHKAAVTQWAMPAGVLSLGLSGYRVMRTVRDEFAAAPAWATYPNAYLERVIAEAFLAQPDNVDGIVADIERKLDENIGVQRAFVPFWGLHLEPDVTFDFGPYRLATLGAHGVETEILKPFKAFRSAVGADQMKLELDTVSGDVDHVRKVPILVVDFEGAAAGAPDVVEPIAVRRDETGP